MSKVILITGASSGIGKTLAATLHARGYQVFGTSRNPATLQSNKFEMLPLDVTDNDSVASCIAQVLQRAGRLDVLVNNAGYDLYAAAQDTDLTDYMAQMETNLWGAVRMTNAVLPMMQAQHSGRIINMSSLGGRLALPFNSAYSASKFALEGYSESLRYELLPANIFVSLVEAGQVKTDSLERSIRGTASGTSRQIALRMQTAGKKAQLTPQTVTIAVTRIIEASRPRLRYVVGSQAHLTLWLQRWLPAGLFEDILVQQFVTPITAHSVR